MPGPPIMPVARRRHRTCNQRPPARQLSDGSFDDDAPCRRPQKDLQQVNPIVPLVIGFLAGVVALLVYLDAALH